MHLHANGSLHIHIKKPQKSDRIFLLFHIDLLSIYLFILGHFWCHTKIRYAHGEINKLARTLCSIQIKSIQLYCNRFSIYCHQINVLLKFNHCHRTTFVHVLCSKTKKKQSKLRLKQTIQIKMRLDVVFAIVFFLLLLCFVFNLFCLYDC